MRCASGHQPEQRAVAVEAPRPPLGNDLEPGLVVAVEQFVGDRAGRRLVGQLERFRAEPLHADDRDQAVGMHAADGVTGLQIFKLHDSLGRLASAGGAPTDARFLGSASPRVVRRRLALSVRSDPAGSTRLPFAVRKNCRSTEASSPRADSCGSVPAVGPESVSRASERQQRPFDDGGRHLSHSDALRDSAEAQRGLITSSRSESSTSATRTIVRNSMFWT